MTEQQMAWTDCGLRPLFEKPLPENPTLLEALSARNQLHVSRPNKPVDPASFTEIFGELHFQEKPDITAEPEKSKDGSSLQPMPTSTVQANGESKSSASCLVLCTEGLGSDSESAVDADDMLKVDSNGGAVVEEEKEEMRPLTTTFPPPIRSIGPRVCFRSFREHGRLVVMEVVTPGKELLHASREGGRLKLQFASASAVAAGVVGVDDEEMHEDEDSHERAR